MAYQLIYTSVRRGLIPGRSGYTVAARHREIRERLVAELERVSSYTFAKSGSSPVVFAHRKLRVSGAEFHILSRIVDAGSDYTGRTNHLAHHLVCETAEIAACRATPAEVIRQFEWRDRFDEEPRYLGDAEIIDLAGFRDEVVLPGLAWESVRGAAADAALPLDGAQRRMGAVFVAPPGDPAWQQKTLDLIAESLRLAVLDSGDPAAAWRIPFTTYLQPADDLADFTWVGCEANHALLAKPGRRAVFEFSGLSQPVPSSALGVLAATGQVAKPALIPRPPRPPMSAPSSGTLSNSPSRPVRSRGEASVAVSPTANRPIVPSNPVPVSAVPDRVVRAQPVFESPRDPAGLQLLRDLRVLIPLIAIVLVSVAALVHLKRNIQPWQELQAAAARHLDGSDFDGANRVLDEMKVNRPGWAQRIDDYRRREVLAAMLRGAEGALADSRDAPDIDTARLRLVEAGKEVGRLVDYARHYTAVDASGEIGDLDRRLARLARDWEQRARVAAAGGLPVELRHAELGEPDLPIGPGGEAQPDSGPLPEEVAIPNSIYLLRNLDITSVAVPESLPDLTHGKVGDKRVTLERAVLATGSPPWGFPAGAGRHDYKFPETAEEDDGSAMSPLASRLDVQIRFQGKGRLQLQRDPASPSGSRGMARAWNPAENSVLRFAGGEEIFWILLWDGRAFPITADSSLQLDRLAVVPSATLGRFLAAIRPAADADNPPRQILMRYVPPPGDPGGGEPVESARLALPLADPRSIAIDFEMLSAQRLERIARLEAQIGAGERQVEDAKGYLEWRLECLEFERALREAATQMLGEHHEILIRYPHILDRPTPQRAREELKNFCADILRYFERRLRRMGVEQDDLDVIDAAISQDEFWDAWSKRQVDAADADEFAAFMASFGGECRRLGGERKSPGGDKGNPFKVSWLIDSEVARAELEGMAEAWDGVFAKMPGAQLWRFTAMPRPSIPEDLESIGPLREDLVVKTDLLRKLRSDSSAVSSLGGGSPPPGIYQVVLIMADGSERSLTTTTIPMPARDGS